MAYHRPTRLIASLAVLLASLGCLLVCSPVRAGMLRIKLNDGNHVDVPYCWKEKDSIRFEVPGGIAGIPTRYVKSIEEIVISSPFTLENRSRDTQIYVKASQKDVDWFKRYLTKHIPATKGYQKLTDDQLNELITRQQSVKLAKARQPQQIYSTSLEIRGKISEWFRLTDDGVMVLLSNAVSSYENPAAERIYLHLYDGDGRLVKQVPCRVQPLKISPQKRKRLGLKGRLYALVATVPPDSRIKRYEITAIRY